MLVFSRNSQYGNRREATATAALNNNDKTEPAANNNNGGSAIATAATSSTTTALSSFFSRATDRQRTGRSSVKKCRPHSWHSTIQKGLARARSRSLGRGDREKDRAKRASSALTTGKCTVTLSVGVSE